jgi:hypothetical protein
MGIRRPATLADRLVLRIDGAFANNQVLGKKGRVPWLARPLRGEARGDNRQHVDCWVRLEDRVAAHSGTRCLRVWRGASLFGWRAT